MEYESLQDECRICQETCDAADLIAPCACTGSQKYVHRKCLDNWRVTGINNSFTECSVCLHKYEFQNPVNEDRLWKKRVSLAIIMFGEMILLCLAAFAANFLVGAMIYTLDRNKSIFQFITLYPAPPDHIEGLLFYNAVSAVISFAILGIYVLFRSLCSEDTRGSDYTYHSRDYYRQRSGNTYNYYDFSRSSSSDDDCGCRGSRGGSRGGSKSGCRDSKKRGDGSELLIIIILVLAVIGVFYFGFVTFKFMYDRSKIHASRIWRSKMLDEFIVKGYTDQERTELFGGV